jgi:Zn-dependent alcohol dehydrogenases
MKALVLEDVKKCVVKEVPDPKIDDDGILVKVMANGVCRSDWHVWAGDISIHHPIMGHELSGIVEEVGKNVKKFKKGDRVIVPFSGSEGTCPHCQAGNSHLCNTPLIPGASYSGGYGEYIAVPKGDRNAIHLPEKISFTEASALGCRFMTAFHGLVDRAKVQPGEWVAVYGCGGVGLSCINVATAMGANVIGVDINDENLQLAKLMGAIYTFNSKKTDPIKEIKELTKGGVDVSVDALGITQTCVSAINSLHKGGRHLQIGVATKQEAGFISIPVDYMVMNEIQFMTALGMPVHRFKDLLPLVEQGRLTPGKMVNREISLSEVNSIFEGMSNFSIKGTFVVTKFE